MVDVFYMKTEEWNLLKLSKKGGEGGTRENNGGG
jgi:hypothetical protein